MHPVSPNVTTILVVDDEKPIRRLVLFVANQQGYTCFHAANGQEALAVLENEAVDVVITDVVMPKMDGIQLTEKIRAKYDTDVIMMTGYIKDLTYGEAIAKGASDFIQKPFDIKEIQLRLARVLQERKLRADLQANCQRLQEILEGVIHALASAVEVRDPYTAGHQRRVADLAAAIAKNMGLSEERQMGVHVAGVIHDLGKLSVPAEILSKPSSLSETEFQIIKTHVKTGYDILKEIKFPWPIADIIYQHHERMDGSGYPDKIKGKNMLLEAKIIAVADVVEAISSHRPYRPALGIEAALAEITDKSGSRYDSDAMAACVQVIKENKIVL